MDIKKELQTIIDCNYLSQYNRKLKEHTLLYNRLVELYGNLPPNELFYCGLHGVYPPECKYDNSKKIQFGTLKTGYNKSCKPSNKCKCFSEFRSEQAKEHFNDPERINSMDIKRKKTNLEKYGHENPFSNKDVQNKIQQTNLDKYGVEYAAQHKDVQEKMKQTTLNKYGVENASQSKVIQEKIKQTNLEKYGVTNYSQTGEYKEKVKNTNVVNYMEYISTKFDNITLIDKLNYNGNKTDGLLNYYNWKCNTCNNVFKDHLANGRMPRCPTCYPHNQSLWELEIQEYISQYVAIEANTKQIINPYELDIYIPSKNIAIECNGTYYHSDVNGKDSAYHLNKTMLCEKQNIQLLHIWEHEYNNKPKLIKSIINSKLGLNDKIYARKTQIQVVDNKTKNVFLDNNHLQGTCASKHNIGLYSNNELVALMTFGKSRFNKKYEWELIRYCSKQNINVIGGASKLFTYFIRNYNPMNIISYADRRYSDGNMYKQLGFTFIDNSPPNFKYTKDYKITYNRIQFQKHKLSEKLVIFDNTLTAEQNMLNAGYDKLWDCGNSVWEWILKKK